MAIGLGEGRNKASDALRQALNHPLLEIDNLEGAKGALVHFTGGESLTLAEVGEAVGGLRQQLPSHVDVVLGATTEASMEGRAQAILIITGLGGRPVAHAAGSGESEAVDVDDLDLPAFLRNRTH